MPDLIAQGSARQERWRKEIPDPASGSEIYLGRSHADWVVPWDSTISGRHLRLTPLTEGRLRVRVLETVTNPVYFRGEVAADFVVFQVNILSSVQRFSRLLIAPAHHFRKNRVT